MPKGDKDVSRKLQISAFCEQDRKNIIKIVAEIKSDIYKKII